MDYSQYETYGFDRVSAFNLSTGYAERSYQAHWHSYGEFLLVGPGKTNIYMVNQKTYEMTEGDFLLVWPMEMHAIIDADRKESLVIQFSNAFINSLFDLQRIMHFYRDLHVVCINSHPELVAKLRVLADQMKEIWLAAEADRELRCCMLLMEFMLTLDAYRDELAPEIRSGDPYSYTDSVMRRIIMVTDYIKNNLTADDLSQGGNQQGLLFPDFPQRDRHELQQMAEHDPPGEGYGAARGQNDDPDGDRDAVRVPEHLQFQPGFPCGKGHVPR